MGTVTSVARHHELGPIALALLRRAVPADEQLTVEITEVDEATGETIPVGRVDAAQEVLVSPEGRAQASPAERPGAELRKGLRRPVAGGTTAGRRVRPPLFSLGVAASLGSVTGDR